MVLTALVQLGLLSAAHATPETTGDALDRLDEVLALRIEQGFLTPADVTPAILVDLSPRYLSSEGWFQGRAIDVLTRNFGDAGLRACEACGAPRTWAGDGSLAWQAGPLGLDEIVRLDEATRGPAAPARTGIWVQETRTGVTIRIVDLGTGRIVFAQNVDPMLVEHTNTARMSTLAEELERRARGDALTQAFVDLVVYPGQHISFDFTDQYGKTNSNFAGITITVLDPVLGVGTVYYRRLPLLNLQVGGKVAVSLPTAVTRSFGQEGEVLDPLLTLAGIVRVPFGRSNYGATAAVSTNGTVGIGLSLLNLRLLPVLP